MALKPPFSSLHYCSEVPGPDASSPVPWPLIVSPPPRSSLPVGIGGWHQRRLNMATPTPSDAYLWRRPLMATPKMVNLLTFSLEALGGSHHVFDFDFDFDFGQRSGTGRYKFKFGWLMNYIGNHFSRHWDTWTWRSYNFQYAWFCPRSCTIFCRRSLLHS